MDMVNILELVNRGVFIKLMLLSGLINLMIKIIISSCLSTVTFCTG